MLRKVHPCEERLAPSVAQPIVYTAPVCLGFLIHLTWHPSCTGPTLNVSSGWRNSNQAQFDNDTIGQCDLTLRPSACRLLLNGFPC